MKRLIPSVVFGLAILLLPGLAWAQQGTVTGRVVEAETGNPLPGATIQVIEESGTGTAAGSDGEYRIPGVPSGEQTIRVTFVGYQAAERTVSVPDGGTVRARFELQTREQQLDEVVVTGYSQQQRQKLSTSISSVSSADIQSSSTTSVQEALQGKAAGVTVSNTAGAPGSGFQVRIRGATSVNASNQPLYVVDGVPVAQGQFTDGFTGGQTVNNALANIDLSNVESIEILKDAAATAIYGTRASNGVVLIETKSGDPGQTQFNFNYSLGSTSYDRAPEFASGEQFARLNREAFRNDCEAIFGGLPGQFGLSGCDQPIPPGFEAALAGAFGIPDYQATPRGNFRDLTEELLAAEGNAGGIFPNGTPDPTSSSVPSFNHLNAITRTGVQHDANLTVSGGEAGEGTTFRYLISGNFRSEDGFLKNQAFERLGGRTNVTYSWDENRAQVSGKVGYSQAETQVIENDNNIDGALTNGLLAPTFEPTFDEDQPAGLNFAASAFDNPVAITRIKRDLVNTKFVGSVEFSYDFLPSLTGRVTGGLDRFDQDEDTFAPSFTREGSPRGSGQDDVFTYANWKTDATLNYDQTFADVHDVVAVGGASFERTSRERVEVIGTDFPTDGTQTLASAAELGGGSGSERSTTGIQSFFGSIDYSYDNRYLLKVTARADGSSRFGEGNQWGLFPATSAGWNINQESFLEGVSWLDQLKLRASYGVTGQQSFGVAAGQFTFPAQRTFGVVDYAGDSGITPGGLPNTDLQWETTTQINFGLDFAFLGQRISGSVDVYQKDTDDLLLNRPLPNTAGFGAFFQNVGEIQNRGIEGQLSTVNIRTENFEWRTTINASSNTNEVQSLVEGVDVIPQGFASVVKPGEPLGAFRGYVVDGLFQNQQEIENSATQTGAEPGDYKFRDLNGDGTIDSDDRKIIGNPFPDIFGGITNTFEYRGFRLNTFLQYSQGNDVFNATDQFFSIPGFLFSTKKDIVDRWTPSNRDASQPRATLVDPNNNARNSTAFVEDGSYLRVKSVTLSYNLPQSLAQNTGLQNARIFVSGKNLLTFTDFGGLDPEINSFGQDNVVQGTTFFAQPIPRFIQAGIEVGL